MSCWRQLTLDLWVWAYILFLWVTGGAAQASPRERVFQQPKAAIQRAIHEIQPSLSGRLPTLEGFATSDQALGHYQHGYYQATLQATSTTSGETLVRVQVKITAWYTDSVPSRSGYQTLTSNGRLESDLLDQLEDQLSKASHARQDVADPKAEKQPNPAPVQPVPSAPLPQVQNNPPGFSTSLTEGLPAEEQAALRAARRKPAEQELQLEAEAKELSELLKNQSRPENLVAVKKGGTPVFAAPDPSAKPLFYASAHDEFEMLNFDVAWVHVRVSGLSRGWIWRDSVEMPENVPGSDQPESTTPPPLFHVTREENAPFPGDWEPLRGKTVKIISVQKIDESAKDSGREIKLEFVKSLLDETYPRLAKASPEVEGVVLIFDAADGGMIAVTTATLKRWETGDLSDSDLWHQCFFDPPEIFEVSGSSVSQ
ncbi:MAG TPA: hypothetical protein VEI01_14475 [Terriglobales bacterium]|nr:hypothetical protein [Terriglobales bacterium]